MSILTASRRKLDVKLVGRQRAVIRQSQLNRLQAASLADCLCDCVVRRPAPCRCSSCAPALGAGRAPRLVQNGADTQGPPGYLQETLPVLTDLGLSANLFHSWADLRQLAEELGDRLLCLTLSSNRLSVPAAVSGTFTFASLQTLVLNATGLSWAQVRPWPWPRAVACSSAGGLSSLWARAGAAAGALLPCAPGAARLRLRPQQAGGACRQTPAAQGDTTSLPAGLSSLVHHLSACRRAAGVRPEPGAC